MEHSKLNELQQSNNTSSLKQKVFDDIANLTSYIQKINQQLKIKLKEKK